MAFDWQEYLHLAKHIRDNCEQLPNEEAALRCAVSRAYYAAFCYACAQAEQRYGFKRTKTPQDHFGLRQQFHARGMSGLTGKLDDLRKWRNDCDYEDDADANLEMMLANAINRAEHIIKTPTPKEG
ncbi:MAG: hypothetical protein AB1631_28070 [Acidobacteriota bacterium]